MNRTAQHLSSAAARSTALPETVAETVTETVSGGWSRRAFLGAGVLAGAGLLMPRDAVAKKPAPVAEGRVVQLPAPDRNGGKPLMACMNARRSTHAPGKKDLSLDDLSAVLWSAFGINSESGKHVVPTAMNRQQLQVYAVLGNGVWLYDPKSHALRQVLAGDRRSSFDNSGCILLYAAPDSDRFAGMHVGSMYQNVGLCCADRGIKNCVKHQKHDALDAELPLPEGWSVQIGHSLSR